MVTREIYCLNSSREIRDINCVPWRDRPSNVCIRESLDRSEEDISEVEDEKKKGSFFRSRTRGPYGRKYTRDKLLASKWSLVKQLSGTLLSFRSVRSRERSSYSFVGCGYASSLGITRGNKKSNRSMRALSSISLFYKSFIMIWIQFFFRFVSYFLLSFCCRKCFAHGHEELSPFLLE